MFRKLTDHILVAPQIDVADVMAAAQAGVTLIINNRPEDESADQTPGAEIECAARAAGLDYVAIPVTHAGFAEWQVSAMADALDKADGKVLAYCRSGTRSTLLWALAQASKGDHPAVLAEKAADAGYDVTPVTAMMDMLRGRAS
ncbi:MAG: TIGR01244 family phosphatase [Sphingorhabdus sp.]|uniref:TIGR01244 family sulfur transferase n=1 Tax=Sphingorhabdus sp. TaxID=1902408 RepID=UPI0025DB116D|nr:TIGR01244 family sulfur transferase [Sphingorhabdus sp.]MCO4090419.1 TIGR01244 family phosphatase [Sphingorhabdus sp.]